MIDSHCHLADKAFENDLADIVARAQAAGVTAAVCILSADEPNEVARAPIVSAAWPAVLFSAGVHPHRAAPYVGRAQAAADATRQAVCSAGFCHCRIPRRLRESQVLKGPLPRPAHFHDSVA